MVLTKNIIWLLITLLPLLAWTQYWRKLDNRLIVTVKLFSFSKTSSECVVVVLEALDVVCPCLEPSSSETHRQAVTTIIDLFDTVHKTVGMLILCCNVFTCLVCTR